MAADTTNQQILTFSALRLFISACSRSLRSASSLFRHWLVVTVSLAVLSGVALPANLLARQRFHHDEALYATWALQIVSGADPWLTHTPIDKPPLFLYFIAGAMSWLGATETAARLPSLLATALTILLTFNLGRKLYGSETGALAAWLVALSPFTILFAPTAFTDPLLVTWALAACLAAAYGRAGWAGAGLGLAMATKQQGVFFMPLVLGLLAIYDLRCTFHALRSTHYTSRITFHASRFILAFLLSLLPLFLWSLNRTQAPDFLGQSLGNYGGLVADTAGFGERWAGFIELLYYATASPVLNLVFIAGLPLLLVYGGWSWRLEMTGDRGPETRSHSNPPSCRPSILPSVADCLFILFLLCFLLGHALLSFQVWDRYLLGLIPLLALLLARILLLPWFIVKNYRPDWPAAASVLYGLALALLLALTLARPVQDAVNGRYPLGSHSQALSGIEQIVAYLQGHAGANHTLYHRWLGTHWRFYLWGYPYDLQYWASPQELAAKARPGHLIAFPSWRSETEARLALAAAGLRLQELARAYHPAGYPSIILYRIVAAE